MSNVRQHPHYGGAEVSCWVKHLLFGFNIVFWLLGAAFLAVGLWAWAEKGVLANLSSITALGALDPVWLFVVVGAVMFALGALDPVWLFVVVGAVMFALGFAGCVGALRENTVLLKFFYVFLGLMLFLQLTAGTLALVFKDSINDQLNFFINKNIKAYRDDIDLQNLIDFAQNYWSCCGALGPDDWDVNAYFNCTDDNPSRERCGVPFSCCIRDPAENVINTQCGYDVRLKAELDQQTFINTRGCVGQFDKWLQDNLTVLAVIFVCVGLLQILGIYLAQSLANDVSDLRASW